MEDEIHDPIAAITLPLNYILSSILSLLKIFLLESIFLD